MTPEENFFKFALTHPYCSRLSFAESKIEDQEIVGLILSENLILVDNIETMFTEAIDNDCDGKTSILLPIYVENIIIDYSKQLNPDYPKEYISGFLENLKDMSNINKLKYLEKILFEPLLSRNIDAQIIYIKTLAEYKYPFLTREITI
jgi:hypothetical protein